MADSFIKVLDLGLETLIFDKFKDIISVTSQDNDMAFMPKEIAFRYVSEKRGAVEMEFMNLWRSNISFDWQRNRSVLALREIEIPYSNFCVSGYSGLSGYTGLSGYSGSGISGYSGYSGKTGSLKAISAKMDYNFWVWSKDKDKLNAVIERYLFWKFHDPNLNLSLNGEIPLEFDLHFGDVVDESTENVMFEKGVYYVCKFPITLDGWIFELSETKIIETIYITGYDDTVDPLGKLLWSTTITSLDEGDDVWA